MESNEEADSNSQYFTEDSQYLKSFARSDIQRHLQSMFYLLREEETLKMVSATTKKSPTHPTNRLEKKLTNKKIAILSNHTGC